MQKRGLGGLAIAIIIFVVTAVLISIVYFSVGYNSPKPLSSPPLNDTTSVTNSSACVAGSTNGPCKDDGACTSGILTCDSFGRWICEGSRQCNADEQCDQDQCYPFSTHLIGACTNINQSGTYALINSFSSASSDSFGCIEITASNVLLDGNGFSVTGNGGNGIVVDHVSGVVIQNIDVDGFSKALVLKGAGITKVATKSNKAYSLDGDVSILSFMNSSSENPLFGLSVGDISIDSGHFDIESEYLLVRGGKMNELSSLIRRAYFGDRISENGAYGGGMWNGSGIWTSLSSINPFRAVGIANGDTYLELYPKSLDSVSSGDIILRSTFLGDANLDGKIDVEDHARLDSGLVMPFITKTWTNGDFNYDGSIDSKDDNVISASLSHKG